MSDTYYQTIVVKIEVEEGADIQDVMGDCDISFDQEKIKETEVIEIQ